MGYRTKDELGHFDFKGAQIEEIREERTYAFAVKAEHDIEAWERFMNIGD